MHSFPRLGTKAFRFLIPAFFLFSAYPPSSIFGASAPGRLLSGPMPGNSSHREVEIVLQAEGSQTASLTYHPENKPENPKTLLLKAPAADILGRQLYHFRPTLLAPGTRYLYQVSLDNIPTSTEKALSFQTLADWQFRASAPDFKFITGSCNYLNDEPYDRPGKPYGQGENILSHMAVSGADFMLWLGDSLYLRPSDYSSPSGMAYRFSYNFSHPAMQPLLRGMHHYATWDDHDYGPDDSNRTFPLKDVSLQLFKSYWANPTYGESDNPGVYTSFTWSDCAFFLMDDRSYRDADELDITEYPEKSQFGKKQRDWLKQSLLANKRATFKFIAIGGQFLHDSQFESFAAYPNDRKDILDFIAKYKINGVIFISGDRHFTELSKKERPDDYPLYDLTSSPIGSGIAAIISKGGEANPLRVPDTLVTTQNYCSVEISGTKDGRKAVLRSYDKENKLRWTHEIKASDLAAPK